MQPLFTSDWEVKVPVIFTVNGNYCYKMSEHINKGDRTYMGDRTVCRAVCGLLSAANLSCAALESIDMKHIL